MVGETEVTNLVEYIVLNAPTFVGLLIAIYVYNRENNKLREEKNTEIQRLQAHNDRLLLWCRDDAQPDVVPPTPQPEKMQEAA